MHACGNKPPVEIKNKGPWVQVDRMRWARQFNVPMADLMPEGFPAVTLPVQRALCAMTIACPGRIPDAFAALYHASFVERKPIHNAELFMPILEKFLGKEVAEEVLAKSTVPETKKLLTAKTDEAFREGAFGLPWFAEATNAEGAKECFWGFDHIGQVAHHLGIEKPKDGSVDGGGWKAML
ncbi:hypothetical protein MMC12_004215 [Toensbergia leucococca]|nr:hypothetical protein [Toensbergia leucococca]